MKAETDTTQSIFWNVYDIPADQTSLLQVKWEFYIGTCYPCYILRDTHGEPGLFVVQLSRVSAITLGTQC